MKSEQFDDHFVSMQLTQSGMFSALQLMKQGYPTRLSFAELKNIFNPYFPNEFQQLQDKMFCELLLHSVGMNKADFKLGITKVFFRTEKLAHIDQIIKSHPQTVKYIADDGKKWLAWSRLSKTISCIKCVMKCKFIFSNNI